MATKFLLLALALFCAAAAAPEAKGGESRIVGGTPVSIQEFPSVISMVYFYPGINMYIQRCVGALISSWHVLTTSFCFFRSELPLFRMRAGSTYSMTGGLVVSLQDAILHPQYVMNPRANDIAVAVLATPLAIGGNIDVLYLPATGADIPVGASLRVVSWGFLSEAGPQIDNLKSIFLNKVSLSTCSVAFGNVANVDISDTVLCAANPGQGTCFGDSGAPMAIGNVIVGIASVYHECSTETYPDVFTRVDRFTTWIMEVARAPGKSGDQYSSPRIINTQ